MKQLAKNYTMLELTARLYGKQKESKRAGLTHLRAIEKSTSMAGNSMARAHARNVVAASGDTAIALRGAIEIHELFPEHAKK